MTTDRRSVGILLFDDVEVLDFAGPFEVFSRARLEPGVEARRSEATAPFTVFTVARTRRPVRAIGGLEVTPSASFADAPGIDLLLVPGGFGTRALLEDREVLEWIQHVAAKAELVTSVCTGALLLAKAGLLRGRRATTHWAALDLLDQLGCGVTVERAARWVDDPDGGPAGVAAGIVSSAGVAAGIDMAFHVVERFYGREVADETAHYIDYPRRREP